jgi:hypothetical protein
MACRLTEASDVIRRGQVSGFRRACLSLGCPDLGPPCLLGRCYSPASRSRKGSPLASRDRLRFAAAHVGVPEGGQDACYAMQFILKSRAFPLELADYGLHPCFWHEAILSPAIALPDGFCGASWPTVASAAKRCKATWDKWEDFARVTP